jgi:hypothetical protein
VQRELAKYSIYLKKNRDNWEDVVKRLEVDIKITEVLEK